MVTEPGDVVIVARIKGASWVTRTIQHMTRSWYSHAMIALGDGRYAHAVPRRGGAVHVLETEDEMGDEIVDRVMYDLYRPAVAPPADRLLAAVEHYQALEIERRSVQDSPCGRISDAPGVLFSDGCLLLLGALKWLDSRPWYLKFLDRKSQIRNAMLVAANDTDGRLFCSEFVHRVLDRAGARPIPPPPGQAFIDLGDLPTDEPKLETMGTDFLFEWLHDRLWACFDFDHRSLKTCTEVVHAVRCHFNLGTPVPVLELGNFLTPSDLALSPSLTKVASRYRLVNGADSGWTDPLPLPPLGRPTS